MEKQILNQIEYDVEMKRLNDEMFRELQPLRAKAQEICDKRYELKSQVTKLGFEYNDVLTAIRETKQKYAELKHEIYLQRPSNAER